MLQYAAQALEDAWTLVSAYKKYGLSNIQCVFQEYEQERILRSSNVVQFARDISTFAHHNGVPKILRDVILRMHDMYDYGFLQ